MKKPMNCEKRTKNIIKNPIKSAENY